MVNGRKWWITGALNPQAEIFIVMGKTDPSADRHRQQSMILVPRDTSGVTVLRGMEVFGYGDHGHGGHAEITFTNGLGCSPSSCSARPSPVWSMGWPASRSAGSPSPSGWSPSWSALVPGGRTSISPGIATQGRSWASQMAPGYLIGVQASSGIPAIAACTCGFIATVTEKYAPARRTAPVNAAE